MESPDTTLVITINGEVSTTFSTTDIYATQGEVEEKRDEELEEEINALIASTAKYIHKYKINPILKAYSKYYYQVKEGFVVSEIKTDHSNEEIESVLLEYKNEYKKPLGNLLKTYFRAKYNPDLKYDESILKQLGFTPCPCCCRK